MAKKTKATEIVKLKERPKGKGKFYLTNKDLLPAVLEAKEIGKLTDKLARMLMILADRYSKKSNFVGYTYREDMVAHALLNLTKNAMKFDPEKSSNPFAYYTSAIRNSFLQYMGDEKTHRYIRDKLLVEGGAEPSFGYTGYRSEKDRKKAEEAAEEANSVDKDIEASDIPDESTNESTKSDLINF